MIPLGLLLLSGTWVDRVYLSKDTLLNVEDTILYQFSNNSVLQNGAEYGRQINITLPKALSGNYYLLFKTDGAGSINESNKNNNLKYLPINISLAPCPDLTVGNITVPVADTIGTSMNVSYTVTNHGAGDITNASWIDNIYLSPTNSINNPNNILLASIAQNRSLPVNGSYTTQAVVTLKVNILHGTYNIVVATDSGNVVFENTGENDNRSISSKITLAPLPHIDLAIGLATCRPAVVSAGQPIQIEYTVKNKTNISTLPVAWTDAVYLSADPILNAGYSLLKSWVINTPLLPGDSIHSTRNVSIPNNANGTYYLLVYTDINIIQNDPARVHDPHLF